MLNIDAGARRSLAGALLAAFLVGAPAARAECTATSVDMPVKMVGTRPIATVAINGTPVTLLVDSGAVFSMLMASTASQLNLPLRRMPFDVYGAHGRIPDMHLTTVDHLKLLDGDLPGIDFMVGGNEIGQTAMGVIGLNILGAVDTEYDLAHGVVRFVKTSADCAKASMAYWAGDTPVSEAALLPSPDTLGNPPIRAAVSVNGHEMVAQFDTGAPSTAVSLSAAHRAGIKDAGMQPDDQSLGAGRGRVQLWSASFDSVSLGGETVRNNRLSVEEFKVLRDDMLIGVDFFLSHRIYVSKKQSRMYFTYNGGPVFAQNHGAAPTAAAASQAASAPDTLSADDHARRGTASLAREDLPAALADLDAACRLDPANAAFLATRARIHHRMKARALALADLDAALRLQPAQPEALMDRAQLLAEMHQPVPAAADLAALDKLLPPQSHDRMQLAMLYSRVRMPDAAIAQWTAWMAAHPHDARMTSAHSGRCWARMAADRELDLAAKDCEEALDDNPQGANDLSSRGWLWLRLGKPAKALADFDQSLANRPKRNEWSAYGRGLAKLRLGNAAGAQADFALAREQQAEIDADVRSEGLPLAPDADAAIAAAAAAASASAAGR